MTNKWNLLASAVVVLSTILGGLFWLGPRLTDGRLIRLLGGVTRGDLQVAERPLPTEHAWGGKHGSHPVRMIQADEGICYLVGLSGTFNGRSVAVIEEVPDENAVGEMVRFWRLRAGPDGSDITARARCWKFPSLPALRDD